jgi:hypothetical protein
MPERSFGQLTVGLRGWTRDHDPHVRAAVELLIWHEHWLRRPDFTRAAVGRGSDGTVYIDWAEAARFVGTAAATRASTSERAILDLAIALGTDIYRFAIMGTAHCAAIAQAVTSAVGIPAGGDSARRAVHTEQRRIQLGLLPLAVTLQRPDGIPVKAVPVADLEQVISRGP